jgi:hypothetical protein
MHERLPVSSCEHQIAREAQNMTISLTPRLRRNGIDDWPIDIRQDDEGVYYKMDHELARVVRGLSNESSSQ